MEVKYEAARAGWLMGLGLLLARLARSTRRAFDITCVKFEAQESPDFTSNTMETSSFSSLPPSSPLSFYSFKDFQSSPRRPNTTDPSPRQYRGIKRLPYELREHCMIYFEEGLCMPFLF